MGRFTPQENWLPLSLGDMEIIVRGLRFGGCYYGYHTSPHLPTSVRDNVTQYIKLLTDKVHFSSFVRKEPEVYTLGLEERVRK